MSDQVLGAEIERIHGENYGVYGARKMHALMVRQGWTLGRDQTARLMRQVGVRGVVRSERVFTTKSDPTGARPTDLVNRQFHSDAPCMLWVADVTYVRTWAGFAYVGFVIDAFSRRIVGWNVASTLRADVLPLQALNMAACSWTTREQLRIAIVSWIERTYHRRRRQPRLGRLTPIEFETTMNTTVALAA